MELTPRVPFDLSLGLGVDDVIIDVRVHCLIVMGHPLAFMFINVMVADIDGGTTLINHIQVSSLVELSFLPLCVRRALAFVELEAIWLRASVEGLALMVTGAGYAGSSLTSFEIKQLRITVLMAVLIRALLVAEPLLPFLDDERLGMAFHQRLVDHMLSSQLSDFLGFSVSRLNAP